jgi:endonuclease/exonuclease/phosphatase family metal-dependent hydrolase
MMVIGGAGLNVFAASSSSGKDITVMSFNVRVDLLKNGRDKLVIDTIKENAPDVFGVQEADITWMNTLKKGLPGYAAIGKGRDLWGAGEHCAIFYRTDKFKAIASDTRWLSSTPTKESVYSYTENGKTYKANDKRIMTYAVLERKSDGARFLFVSTHLDNNGNNSLAVAEKIRKGQIEVMINQIQGVLKARGNLPTIVLGDFNATPEKTAAKTMTSKGYYDASKIAATGTAQSTYNGMSEGTSAILDYIFVSSNLKSAVKSYKVCPAKRSGKWVSDHNAIVATITLPKV